MANRPTLISTFVFISAVLLPEADAGIISDIEDAISDIIEAIEYFLSGFVSIGEEILNPPRNKNCSIQYELFTPDSPHQPCYLEQNEKALERCPFNASYPLKILIHGYLTTKPSIWNAKNNLLALYVCNVIAMDWRRYNQPPYYLAAFNTQLVGHELAKLLQFMEDKKGLDPQNVHLVGHSLGAHLAGVAGKDTPNLGRISGLDPAHPLFGSESLFHRLKYTDADFVDVIHTSASSVGWGIPEPIGDQDFYPNGGSEQPQCVNRTDWEESFEDGNINGPVSVDVDVCDHSSSIVYFTESIDTAMCDFLSAMCDSYEDFQAGDCTNSSNVLLAEMGLPAQPIPGLGPTTKFYLRTGPFPPFCLEDGYEPK